MTSGRYINHKFRYSIPTDVLKDILKSSAESTGLKAERFTIKGFEKFLPTDDRRGVRLKKAEVLWVGFDLSRGDEEIGSVRYFPNNRDQGGMEVLAKDQDYENETLLSYLNLVQRTIHDKAEQLEKEKLAELNRKVREARK